MGKVKIQESKGRFSITLPKDIIERTGLKKGDSLFVAYDRRSDVIEIERKKD
jgi:bifunctional DNA-binding transcriptional regulator/antitoxin component of YhaV-PrlF toxin-antitoxin module